MMEGIQRKSYSEAVMGEEESEDVCGGFGSQEDRHSFKQGR